MAEAGEPPAGQKVQQAGSAEAEQDVIAVLSDEESIAAEWAELSPRVAAEISERIHGVNQKTTSLKKMRRMLSEHLGLGKKGLELHIEAVSVLIASAVQEVTAAGQPKVFTPAERMASIVQDLGDELTEAKQCVYLATVSRVLPETLATPGVELRDITTMSREEVADCFMKAFNSPVYEQGQGGRRRQSEEPMVSKIVVFKEEHEDGDFHFHIVIVLKGARSWKPAKRTLRIRDQVACHFSCSHTQAWSAIRYGHIPTINKPKVDAEPYSWSDAGGAGSLDLFALSQRPFNAKMWTACAEAAEKKRLREPKPRPAKFSKLDLTAIILDKSLKTKTEILEYCQDSGTEKMQEWVSANQKKLKEFLSDAQEWGTAREQAKADRETDWALLCRLSEGECPHGDQCTYAKPAQAFFDGNAATINKVELAAAIRAVVVGGPSKTTRTPLIVGPSNSGKTTIVAPFDQAFGKKRVFHKPALDSNFPLRNITKEKRFLFWDDYRPVEHGQSTVPVTTFLSLFNGLPFEVAMSQAFNDGNEDFEWRRGALLTAKEKDLWAPWGDVYEEDVKHMRNRCYIFRATAVLYNLKDTEPCACHMCKWIASGANQADSNSLLRNIVPVLPLQQTTPALGASLDANSKPPAFKILGLQALTNVAKLPMEAILELEKELVALGAVHVKELTGDDWQAMTAWTGLGQFAQRRLLQQVFNIQW